MRSKILVILAILVIFSSNFIVSANIKQKGNIKTNSGEVIEIRVAIYTDEKEDDDFYSSGGRTRYFIYALKNYEWTVGEKSYRFVPTVLPTSKILRGKLNTDLFDVLTISYDQVLLRIFASGSKISLKDMRVKSMIRNFIRDGGGYYGSCAGSLIMGTLVNEPESFMEKMWKNSCLGISGVDIYYKDAIPMFLQWTRLNTNASGSNGYNYYSSWNSTDYNLNYYTGVCLDVSVCKNNPIFDDYLGCKRKIRWNSGSKLMIPDSPDRNIIALAYYPEEEMSDNISTQIHHWKYTGGIRGMISAVFNKKDEYHYLKSFGIFMDAQLFAYDWERTDQLVETNFSNAPFMTAEEYPNENKARLVLCAGHPEMNVWWGGHIEEREDTDKNCMYDGFHHWVDVTPENETAEDEFSYNYWILRRSFAWASKKVPDDSMPPIDG
jgi:hypothetical protein